MATPVELHDGDRARATVYPELGGWLTRYSRQLPGLGWVEGLHHDDAVVARYPDRMWAGNPVLFPHVSFNVHDGKDGHYELDGQVLASPQHGFARRVPWQVLRQSAGEVVMELTASERTRPSYPFAFRHELAYRLVNGRLEWEQVIENRDRRPLPFSTGFHPYLPVPVRPGGERNRCFFRLPRGKRFNPLNRAEAFFDEPFPAQDFSVALDTNATVLLGDFAEQEIALVDPTAGVEVAVNFADHPAYRYAVLWSPGPEAPFYCVEPWTALPNSFGRPDGEILVLRPGESFRARLWMDVRPVGATTR